MLVNRRTISRRDHRCSRYLLISALERKLTVASSKVGNLTRGCLIAGSISVVASFKMEQLPCALAIS